MPSKIWISDKQLFLISKWLLPFCMGHTCTIKLLLCVWNSDLTGSPVFSLYLFIFGCAGSLLLLPGLFYSCWERGLLFVAVRVCRVLLPVAFCWGTQALGAGASVVVAHRLGSCSSLGLSCSVACGIFPDQGSNPRPLRWQANSLPLCHQGILGALYFHLLNMATSGRKQVKSRKRTGFGIQKPVFWVLSSCMFLRM